MNPLQARLLQPVHGGGQARDAVAVKGTRLQADGILGRLLRQVRLHAGPAVFQGPDLHAGPDAHASRPLGAHQPLVAGKAQHVRPQIVHVDRSGAGGLGRVHHQQGTVFMGHLADSSHVRHVAGQVGGVGTDHQPGAGADQPLQLPVVQPALPVRAGQVQVDPPLRLQAVEGPQHGVVLQHGGDHPVPLLRQPEESDVQGLRHVAGKDHVVGPGTAEQSRQLLPGGEDGVGCVQSAPVDAPGAVAQGIHGGRNGLRHPGRLPLGRRRVIQIDHCHSP